MASGWMRGWTVGVASVLLGAGLAAAERPAEEARAPVAREDLPEGAIVRLGSLRLRHDGAVRGIVWAADGSRLWSVGSDRTLREWAAADGRLLRRTSLAEEEGSPRALALREDGTLVTTGQAGEIWQSRPGTGPGAPVRTDLRDLRVAAGGVRFAGGAETPGSAVLLGPGADDRREVELAGDRLTAAAWGDAEGPVALASWARETRHTGDGHVVVLAADGTVATRTVVPGVFVGALAISPDEVRVALGGADGSLRLLDIADGATGEPRAAGERPLTTLAFSPDGTLLATGDVAGTVRVHDAETGDVLRAIDAHALAVTALAFAPDGATLATGGEDLRIRLFDPLAGAERLPQVGHVAPISAVAFAPDGATVATGSFDSTVRLWDAATGAELRVLPAGSGYVNDVAFAPSGAALAVCGQDGTLRLFDVATGEERAAVKDGEMALFDLAYAPDGERIASAGADGQVRVHDAATGRVLLRIAAGKQFVFAVAWAPDGERLAAGTSLVLLGDAEGEGDWTSCAGPRAPVNALTFDAAGRVFSGSADRLVRAWDPESGQEVLTFAPHLSRVTDLDVSGDGRFLVSCGGEPSFRVADLRSGAVLRTVAGHAAAVLAVAFDGAGERIVSGGMDSVAYLWRR